MPLPLQVILALAEACAPNVAPTTLASIVQVESHAEPLAISVNGAPRVSVTASTPTEASAKAAALIASGRSVDLGLAQINSRNLGWLGLRVEDAFVPCLNLAAGARVLRAGYTPQGETDDEEQVALRVALSRYNSGDSRRGISNGYVAKVTRAAAELAPAIATGPTGTAPRRQSPAAPAWDVFASASGSARLVFISNPTGDAP